MTDVEVFHHHQLRPLQHGFSSFDSMPDEEEVRDITGPLMTGENSEDVVLSSAGDGEKIPRHLVGVFADVPCLESEELTDVNCNFNLYPREKDAHRSFISEEESESKTAHQVVRVQSSDISASYQVHGLQPHEMPVIGVHVDSRIMPGFRYRVRIITSDSRPKYQFGGEPLHLQRIGQGYGKRLTFTPNSLNDNTNYFWSDSNPRGYGFGIVAVQRGDQMVMTDLSRRPIGTGSVEEASPCQTELSTELVEDLEDGRNTLVKRVSVIMKVRLRYTCERHGMRSLRADETVIVRGVAKVVKPHGETEAHTKCIEKFELPNLGECFLYMVQ